MSDMSLSDSDLSSLSSAPLTDDDVGDMAIDEPNSITRYFQKEPESPPVKRAPSPPHEYVLADNQDIAFIVMFRARFNDVFPRSLPHYGPQDIERGVADPAPGDHVERLLCALLGLVLNRKKDIERNHYQRPLEEAIQTHAMQWPKAWEGKNPLHGGRTFAAMSPEERLQLLRALILWSLSSSDIVQAKIKESYKQSRHEDDLNQPLSVQPWGTDSLKRRYWLIEGLDDTHFRLYRESNPKLKNISWWSVAGDIPELRAVADKLDEDKGTNSKRLSERIRNAIPRFEGGEEKRRRRDYRLARKAAFARPEPGFSLYEGRTRGKKLKYTYSDDDDFLSDGLPSTRRSTRNTSAISTPAESAGPKFTASGRQIRAPAGGLYGETLLSGQREDAGADHQEAENGDGRSRRTRTSRVNGYDESHDDDDDADDSHSQSSGNEWEGGDEEEEDENDFEGDDEDEHEDDVSGDEEMTNGDPPSLVVQLRYGKSKLQSSTNGQTGEPLRQPNQPDEVKPSQPSSVELRDVMQQPQVTEAQGAQAPAPPPVPVPPPSPLPRTTETEAHPSNSVFEDPSITVSEQPTTAQQPSKMADELVQPMTTGDASSTSQSLHGPAADANAGHAETKHLTER